MIEQGIYFALGCIVTALCALAFAPIFWRRALRLTRHRMQAQAPMSMQEILAERDALRARFAVDRVRLEQEVDRVRATKAADLAEIGRRTAAVATLTDELIALKRVERAQEREIAVLGREAAEAAAILGAMDKELHDAAALAGRHRDRAEAARRASERLEGEAAEARAATAALAAHATQLELRSQEGERAAAARLRAAETEAAARHVDLSAELARHRSETDALRRDAELARTALARAEADLAEVKAAAGAFAEGSREREKALHLQNSLRAERVRGEQADVAGQLAASAEEVATLRRERDAALAALKEDESRRVEPREGGRPARQQEPGDAELRASIHALGLAVAELARGEPGAPPRGDPGRDAPMQAPAHVAQQVVEAR